MSSDVLTIPWKGIEDASRAAVKKIIWMVKGYEAQKFETLISLDNDIDIGVRTQDYHIENRRQYIILIEKYSNPKTNFFNKFDNSSKIIVYN